MEKLSKFVLSRLALRQTQSDDHLEGNELNAFLEGNLKSNERSLVLAHLSVCAECREILALASGVSESPSELAPATHGAAWWKWRLAAGVAVAGLVGVIVWFPSFVPQQKAFTPSPVIQKGPEPKVPPSPSIRPPQPAHVIKPRSAVPRVQASPPQSDRNDDSSAKPAQVFNQLTLDESAPEKLRKREVPSRAEVSSHAFIAGRMQSVNAVQASPRNRQVIWDIANNKTGSQNENGILLKSNDGGKSWQSVQVDGATRLNALSVSGPEIWVGGADGALFHSVDDGLHWALVRVADGDDRLMGTITRIVVGDDQSVKLTVSHQSDWTSLDGGLHWQQR